MPALPPATSPAADPTPRSPSTTSPLAFARQRFAPGRKGSRALSSGEVEAALELQKQNREAELLVAGFRTLIILLAVFAPSLLGLSGSYQVSDIWLVALAGLYNIITGLSCLRPDRYGLRRSFVVAMDMMLVTLWIRISGQWELFPFYYLVVVVAAMWFRVLGGALAATFCDFFFLYLWSRAAGNPEIVPPVFTTSMALNLFMLVLVGFLVGYIAEIQERERESRLESQLLVANYQREIDLSSQLQPLLLSPESHEDEALELGFAMQSARRPGGGDYADAVALPDGRTLVCIADVAGKSVRAQARLPLLKYSLRSLAPLHPEPGELVQRLNETLAPDLSEELYIAFCCVVFDSTNQVLRWCNAGHIAPLLLRGNKTSAVVPLAACGPPLGMFPEINYAACEAEWHNGCHLLMFTDGLADALSYNGSEDGEAQVRSLALRLAHETERTASEVAEDFIAIAEAALEASEALPERLRLQFSALRPRPVGEASTVVAHRDDVTVVVARAKQGAQ